MKIMDEDDMKNDGVYNLDIKKMVDCGEVILEERTDNRKGRRDPRWRPTPT